MSDTAPVADAEGHVLAVGVDEPLGENVSEPVPLVHCVPAAVVVEEADMLVEPVSTPLALTEPVEDTLGLRVAITESVPTALCDGQPLGLDVPLADTVTSAVAETVGRGV